MMPENRVIIAGSREFTDQTKLNKVCRWIFKTARIPVSGTTIISGTCRGTDKMGEEYAREEGMAVARFPADWSRYGKMAGPRRNGEMARYAMKKGCNGVLIAFLRADSRGTKNMIDTAVKMKLETYVVKYEEKIIEKYNFEVCRLLGIRNYTINIRSALEASFKQLHDCGIEITKQCRQNIAPRERTKMIRAVCQCNNGRMINTCNYSEDYVGYFTIGGDGDGDVAPLGYLTKSEVCAIGHCLGLPSKYVDKTPSDGLCGKTDEDNFGFTYEQLDTFIRNETCGDKEIDEAIKQKHLANEFKLNLIAKYEPGICEI